MNKKINILYVIPQLERGGSEQLVYNLASYFCKLNFNIYLVYLNFFDDNDFLQEFQRMGVRTTHIPKKKRIDFLTMINISKFIRTNQIDIVHAHHFHSMIYSFWGTKIKNKIPLIYTEHSSWELENLSMKWAVLNKLIGRKVDHFVGISSQVTQSMKRIFSLDDDKITTIMNGINVEMFSDINVKKNLKLKRKLNIDDKDNIIGVVANLKKIKNHLFLLKAFKEIVKVKDNLKLIFIGQGSDLDEENSEKEIQDYIKQNDLAHHVLLLGKRNDVPDLLQTFDVFCLTSFKEGLPLSILEAMASGLPIVGTNVAGISQLIQHEYNGFLVEVGDIRKLKYYLLLLLNNKTLRKKMGEKSIEIINDSYSLKKCSASHHKLYNLLVGENEIN